MPLQFADADDDTPKKDSKETKKEKPSKSPIIPFARKKKEDKKSVSNSSKGKTAGHRRVFTKSSNYFAKLTITVVKVNELPCKKSIQPYVQLYLGSNSFSTKVKKKTINPVYNEEFSADVDRDDSISIKVWDMGKIERNVDAAKKIEPISKKKFAVKELAREGNLEKKERNIVLVGGGSIDIILTFQIQIPVPGQIHTKIFSYPSWKTDRYGVNQVEPDVESINVGWATIARYTSRWLLNQRAIQASLQNDEEEENSSEVPEGLQFELIDISCCSHDKALQLVVAYKWKEEENKIAEDDDNEDLFVRPKILTSKLFTTETKISKKKLYDHKGMSVKSYQGLFTSCMTGLEDVTNNAMEWIEENKDSYQEVYKFIPITTVHSNHILVWYYK